MGNKRKNNRDFMPAIFIGIRRRISSLINNQIFQFFIAYIMLAFLSLLLPKVKVRQEFNVNEIIQVMILIYCMILNFKNRKLFNKVSNSFAFFMKQSFFLFLIYEELSFLTFNSNNTFNYQNEFNFHNSFFMQIKLFSFGIPRTDSTFTLTVEFLLYAFLLFLLGYGSYFSFLKKFKFFFLEKQYAVFTFLFVVSKLIDAIFIDLNIYPFGKRVVLGEYLELFIYLLFLVDTFTKRKIIFKRYNE